jgi:site-specific recombinase XerD
VAESVKKHGFSGFAGIEDLFKSPRARRRLASSHLHIIIEAFALDLQARGYSRKVLYRHVGAVAHFGRWLKDQRVGLEQLSTRHVQEFLRQHLARCRCASPVAKAPGHCRAGLGRLVEFLRRQKRIREFKPKADRPTPIDQLLAAYERHLDGVCGLSEPMRRRYHLLAREFLRWRFGSRPPRLDRLVAKDIRDFMRWRAGQLGFAGIRSVAACLRRFLGFLEFSGRRSRGLVPAVPQVRRPASPAPAKFLTRAQWRRFLKSFVRSTAKGRRDYAIALCLGGLALRAQEVAALTLEDLDWRVMTVRLRQTKGRRERLLPLAVPVAKALLDYLKRGRPHTQSRALFLHGSAPFDRGLTAQGVRKLVGKAFARCGIKASGAHILRHTWATWAHRRGTDLKVIADMLGHRSVETTQRYAHVHLEELRQVALPWPGSGR